MEAGFTTFTEVQIDDGVGKLCCESAGQRGHQVMT